MQISTICAHERKARWTYKQDAQVQWEYEHNDTRKHRFSNCRDAEGASNIDHLQPFGGSSAIQAPLQNELEEQAHPSTHFVDEWAARRILRWTAADYDN